MPEITDREYQEFTEYRLLGSPEEIRKKRASLEADNHTQREEIRELKAAAPGDDEVVIKKDVAAGLEQYTELGTPAEISAQLKSGQEAQESAARMARRQSVEKFVAASGLSEEAVETLLELPSLDGATFEVRKGKKLDASGKEVEGSVGYITLPGDDQKAMSFEKARDSIPVLKGLRTADATPPDGTRFNKQGPPGSPPSGDELYAGIRKDVQDRRKAAAGAAPTHDEVAGRLGMTTR